jgi:hypothetical protein
VDASVIIGGNREKGVSGYLVTAKTGTNQTERVRVSSEIERDRDKVCID